MSSAQTRPAKRRDAGVDPDTLTAELLYMSQDLRGDNPEAASILHRAAVQLEADAPLSACGSLPADHGLSLERADATKH